MLLLLSKGRGLCNFTKQPCILRVHIDEMRIPQDRVQGKCPPNPSQCQREQLQQPACPHKWHLGRKHDPKIKSLLDLFFFSKDGICRLSIAQYSDSSKVAQFQPPSPMPMSVEFMAKMQNSWITDEYWSHWCNLNLSSTRSLAASWN